jgi:HD-GYP domain-containing protein (c-di-GMP phosphodiesterase class II)
MVYRDRIEKDNNRFRSIAWLALRIVVVSAVLALTTVLISAFAAVVLVCAVLWVGLFVAVRHIRNQDERSRSYIADVTERYDSIIGVLCGALELKDDIGAVHTSRVTTLASVIATEAGMRRDEIRLLQKASILADIGKIEIAQDILSKPGSLSDSEWREMKRHPEYGHRILSSIPALSDASEVVCSHHERFDGQGYPRGLKGDEIPLGARVFSVADAYCAMTSDRPHRKKMSHEMAVKEILRNSLTQFDPEVVRAFVRCEERGEIENGPIASPEAQAAAAPAPSSVTSPA